MDSDSGEEIAKALGMAVTVVGRDAYLEREDRETPEAEFFSHGLEGTDVNTLGFEPQIRHSVFVTGFHGDVAWDKDAAPSRVIRRGDLVGGSLAEFRRRVDFVHVLLPFVGTLAPCRSHRHFQQRRDGALLGRRRIRPADPTPHRRRGGCPARRVRPGEESDLGGFLRLPSRPDRPAHAIHAPGARSFCRRLASRSRRAAAVAVERGGHDAGRFVRLVEKKAGLARRLGLTAALEKILHILHTRHLTGPVR